MFLREIVDNTDSNVNGKYKLFVDLDGVLVDFDTTVQQITGMSRNEWTAKENRNKFWRTLERYAKNGHKIWGAMGALPDAMTLWNYVRKYDPDILTATGHIKTAGPEKREWVQHHLGPIDMSKVLLVRDSRDKAQYAAPNHILIDDREKSIGPWVEAGGIGILHKSAADTIQQLKQLGL